MINSESFIAFFLSWVKWPSNTTWYVIHINPYLFKSMGHAIHDLWKTNAPAIFTLRKPSLRTLVMSDLPSWVIRDLLGLGAWWGTTGPQMWKWRIGLPQSYRSKGRRTRSQPKGDQAKEPAPIGEADSEFSSQFNSYFHSLSVFHH